MLGVIFGFSGRIGRLQYLILSFALWLAAILVLSVIFFGIVSRGASGATEDEIRSRTMLALVLIVPLFGWFSLALQAKRIRDIGWSPLLVISGWIAANLIDGVIARVGLLHPLAPNSGTAVGSIANLALMLVLLFWPSSEVEPWSPSSMSPSLGLPSGRPPVPAPVVAESMRVDTIGKPMTFGRRGR